MFACLRSAGETNIPLVIFGRLDSALIAAAARGCNKKRGDSERPINPRDFSVALPRLLNEIGFAAALHSDG